MVATVEELCPAQTNGETGYAFYGVRRVKYVEQWEAYRYLPPNQNNLVLWTASALVLLLATTAFGAEIGKQ